MVKALPGVFAKIAIGSEVTEDALPGNASRDLGLHRLSGAFSSAEGIHATDRLSADPRDFAP